MSVTLEQPVPITARPDLITYYARRDDLRLVWKPRYKIINPQTGQHDGFTQGVYVNFEHGRLAVPREGSVLLRDRWGGGVYKVDDVAELHAWLREHPMYGNGEEGFREIAEAAPEVTPAELEALIEATSSLDVEALEALLGAERAGYARPAIVGPAEKALERWRAVERELVEKERAQASAAAAEVAAGAEARRQAEEAPSPTPAGAAAKAKAASKEA